MSWTEVFEIPVIQISNDFAFIIALFLADHKDIVNIEREMSISRKLSF